MIPAKGSTHKGKGRPQLNGRRRTMIAFDDDQFEEIRQRAVWGKTSFAEQVRILVEWGLEA